MMGFEKKFIRLPNKSIVLSFLNKKCSDGHIQHCQTSSVKYCRCRKLIQFKWEWKVSWCAWVNNSTSLWQRIDRQDRVCRQFRGYKLPTNILKQVWKKKNFFLLLLFLTSQHTVAQTSRTSWCFTSVRQKYMPACCHIKCCCGLLSFTWSVKRLRLSQLERPSYINSCIIPLLWPRQQCLLIRPNRSCWTKLNSLCGEELKGHVNLQRTRRLQNEKRKNPSFQSQHCLLRGISAITNINPNFFTDTRREETKRGPQQHDSVLTLCVWTRMCTLCSIGLLWPQAH